VGLGVGEGVGLGVEVGLGEVSAAGDALVALDPQAARTAAHTTAADIHRTRRKAGVTIGL
jgi:hypothetical protein